MSKVEDQKDELSVTDTPRYVIFLPTLILSLMHKKRDKSVFKSCELKKYNPIFQSSTFKKGHEKIPKK